MGTVRTASERGSFAKPAVAPRSVAPGPAGLVPFGVLAQLETPAIGNPPETTRGRAFGLGIGLVTLLLVGSCSDTTGPAPKVPGLARTMILVVADDLGFGDLGCYGSTEIATPHLDRLAGEGARFTSFYANAPICSPTRASILSGLYPAQTGVLGAILPRERAVDTGRLRRDLTLLPELLRDAGWRTALVGKWHLGYESPDLPRERGFDEFAGYHQGTSYDTSRRVTLLRGDEPWATSGLLPRVLTDEALRVLEAQGSPEAEPLFLCLWFKSPHESLEHALPFLEAEVAAHRARGAGAEAALYYAVVEELDRQVGRLLAELERLGRADTALVAFVSDNGPNMETPGASAGPFRFGKGSVFEGGLRVPALLRWPGQVAPGAEVGAPAATCDLFATFLRAAGAAVPPRNAGAPLEALDLVPAVRGEDAAFRDRDLFWFDRSTFAVRRDRWKLVASLGDVGLGDWAAASAALPRAAALLYDMTESPVERHDRAADQPEIAAELRALLAARLLSARLGAAERGAAGAGDR